MNICALELYSAIKGRRSNMSFLHRSKEILGMNARNLLYIERYNSKANKRFADDKLFTKQYLESRGIGVARVYAVIKNMRMLRAFDPAALPKSFVVKPNRGYGGEGIIVIVEHQSKLYTDAAGTVYNWEELFLHIISILEGKYAISGLRDTALIEERLETASYLLPYVTRGLPDFRVIVFKQIPVLAMLRLPTIESHGKANLHLGAIGIGIHIATGKTTYAVSQGKFVTRLSGGISVREIEIQDWDAVLLTAARTAQVSHIGYLAADIAPTKTGLKVLELNARPGLSVQIANQVPLRKRLEQITDVKALTAEQGVAACKVLFGEGRHETPDELMAKEVIGPYEKILVLGEPEQEWRAKIDLTATHNSIRSALMQDLPEPLVTVKLRGKRLVLPVGTETVPNEEPYDIIIAGKFLSDFLVDPALTKEDMGDTRSVDSAQRNERIIRNIDRKIRSIHHRFNTIAALKPLNLGVAKKEFLRHPIASPVFEYRPISDVDELERELRALPSVPDHPLSQLYHQKIFEFFPFLVS